MNEPSIVIKYLTTRFEWESWWKRSHVRRREVTACSSVFLQSLLERNSRWTRKRLVFHWWPSCGRHPISRCANSVTFPICIPSVWHRYRQRRHNRRPAPTKNLIPTSNQLAKQDKENRCKSYDLFFDRSPDCYTKQPMSFSYLYPVRRVLALQFSWLLVSLWLLLCFVYPRWRNGCKL